MVILGELVAKVVDPMDYTTLVFKVLDGDVSSKYIMCIKYPNWNDGEINIGDIGYLNYVEIRAGIDKWFDGKSMIPYNYNNIQYIKFVRKPEEKIYEYRM